MANQMAYIAVIVLSLLFIAPSMTRAQPTTDQWDSGYLVAAKKSKKNKKKRKGKKSKKSEAADMSQGEDDRTASTDAAAPGDYKKFGIKASSGYINSSVFTKDIEDIVADGNEVTAGFAFAILGSAHYYLSPNLFVLGEFGFGYFPMSGTYSDSSLGLSAAVEGSQSLIHFGGGGGYDLKFTDSVGAELGSSIGYDMVSATLNVEGVEPVEGTGSGLSFSFFANIYYAFIPAIRVGFEPRIIYSLATDDEVEGEEPATTEEEESEDSIGLAMLALLSVGFLF